MDKLSNQFAKNHKRVDSLDWMDFVMRYSYDYDSRVFGLMKDNIPVFVDEYGVDQVNQICIDVFIGDAMYSMYEPNATKLIKEVNKKIKKHKLFKFDKALHVQLSEVMLEPDLAFKNIDDNVDFVIETMEYIDNLGLKQTRRVLSNVALYSEDRNILNKVKDVLNTKLNDPPNIYYYDLMSIVLYKLREKEESYKMVADANALAHVLKVKFVSGLKTMKDRGLIE